MAKQLRLSQRKSWIALALAGIAATIALPGAAALPDVFADDPRCVAFAALDEECAWPWGVWDAYSSSEARDRIDVCVALGGPAGLLNVPCNFVDHQSGENNGIGAAALAQIRLPRLRASDYLDHAMRLTTTGDWGGQVDLGEDRLAGGEWTEIGPSGLSLSEAAIPYHAWLYANCRLNQTFGASEECAALA